MNISLKLVRNEAWMGLHWVPSSVHEKKGVNATCYIWETKSGKNKQYKYLKQMTEKRESGDSQGLQQLSPFFQSTVCKNHMWHSHYDNKNRSIGR